MEKKIIKSVTIEDAALYNEIYDDSSVTVELYQWYDEFYVTVETPEGWWDAEFETPEKATEHFDNEVERYKMIAADHRTFAKLYNER